MAVRYVFKFWHVHNFKKILFKSIITFYEFLLNTTLFQVELPGGAMKKHEEAGCPFEMIHCLKRKNGCKLMISRRLMSSHIQNCEYRLVDCPLSPSCKEKIVKKRLLNHLETFHIKKGIFGRTDDSFANLLLIALVLLCFLSFIINLFFFLYYVK